MKRTQILLVVATMLTALNANLVAQDVSFEDYAEVLSRLETLEAQMARGSGRRCCQPQPGCHPVFRQKPCGWFSGFELVIAKPFFEDESEDIFADPRYRFEASPRFWVGYRASSGLGIRARTWLYSATSSLGNPNNGTPPFSLDTHTVDLEMTQILRVGCVNMDLAGGIRYAYMGHHDVTGLGAEFQGAGPTLAFTATAPLYNRLGIFGTLRSSFLYGETQFLTTGQPDPFTGDDDYTCAMEAQAGLKYQQCLGTGVLSFWVAVEGQHWAAVMDEPDSVTASNSTDENLGFFGFVGGVGYTF